MAKFRIETVFDSNTGRYFVEVYQDGETVPLVVGKPIYMSHEHAMADSVELFKRALPTNPLPLGANNRRAQPIIPPDAARWSRAASGEFKR